LRERANAGRVTAAITSPATPARGWPVRSRLKDDGRGAELALAAAHLLFVKRAATAMGEPLNGASRHQHQAAW
jgi:hypothetical protein